MKPRCVDSLIAAVSSGPGIIAPDRAMMKDVAKMVKNAGDIMLRAGQSTFGSVSNPLCSSASVGTWSVIVPSLYCM